MGVSKSSTGASIAFVWIGIPAVISISLIGVVAAIIWDPGFVDRVNQFSTGKASIFQVLQIEGTSILILVTIFTSALVFIFNRIGLQKIDQPGAKVVPANALAEDSTLNVNVVNVGIDFFYEFPTGEDANDKINDCFLNAKKKIRCMGVSFAYGREKFSAVMFMNKLLEDQCDIQIIIADKNSPMLNYLGGGKGTDIDIIKQDIQATIDFFNNLKERTSGNKDKIQGSLKLFTHKEIPHRGYSSYDDQCFITPYFYNKNAANGPVLNITNEKSALYSEYQNYYRHCRSRGKLEVSIDRFS